MLQVRWNGFVRATVRKTTLKATDPSQKTGSVFGSRLFVFALGLVFMFFASITEDFDTTENWVGTMRATFKNDLGEGFTLSLVAQMDYDNLPAPGFRHTDFRLIAVLGWTFGW